MSDRREQWRETARRLLAGVPDVIVSQHADVHEMQDGGAYVECIVWVRQLKQPDDEHKS